MKVKLEVVIVMMASVLVGVSSTTSVFGGLLDGTPVSIPDIRNSNGSLFL